MISVSAVPLRIFVFLTTSRLPSRRRLGFSETQARRERHPRRAQNAFYRHEKFYVALLLKIERKTVRKVAQAEVSGLAEGIAFSPDGRYLYVRNLVDGNVDILRLDGDALTKVASFALPEHPASMRGSTP